MGNSRVTFLPNAYNLILRLLRVREFILSQVFRRIRQHPLELLGLLRVVVVVVVVHDQAAPELHEPVALLEQDLDPVARDQAALVVTSPLLLLPESCF